MNPLLQKLFDSHKDKLFSSLKETMKESGKDFMIISFDENGAVKTESYSNEERKIISPVKLEWYNAEINELRKQRQYLRIEVNKLRSEINQPLIDWTAPGAINQIS